MRSAANQKILNAIENLIALEGISEIVYAGMGVDFKGEAFRVFSRFAAGYKNVLRLVGPLAGTFSHGTECRIDAAAEMIGSLEAIRDAIKDDLLISVESLVRAEVFSDLLEQAEHLLAEGYFLPAGVLGRAVLEDHLRKWCDRAPCLPAKPKPTINDFNSELYKAKHLSLADMKHVEAMAAVGNDAAHNKPTLTRENVERFVPDVRRFLAQHPIP